MASGSDNFDCKGYKNKPCPTHGQQLKQTRGQQFFYNTQVPYTYCSPIEEHCQKYKNQFYYHALSKAYF